MKLPCLRSTLSTQTLILLLIGALSMMVSSCPSGTSGPGRTGRGRGGFVLVGFVAKAPADFQQVLLNISAVRLNPDSDAGAQDSKWVTIPVPTGVGQSIAAKPGNLQVDLNTIQSMATLFNTGDIPPNEYEIVELLLDINTPGTLVPRCASGGTVLEGCINYPIQLEQPGVSITTVPAARVQVGKNTLTPLVLQITLTIVNAATFPGGPFTVDVDIEVVNQQTFLATVSGSVSGGDQTTRRSLAPLTVTAELSGTNTVIASAPVVDGGYTLALPAASGPLGTTYDLYVSGGKASFAAVQGVNLTPGANVIVDFDVSRVDFGTISGKIIDACTFRGIPGAVVQILVPPVGVSADCTLTPEACVSVATATTDNTGSYPLPGSSRAPAPFDNLPIGETFTLFITAAGFDSLLTTGRATGGPKGGSCPESIESDKCTFTRQSAFLRGTVTLANPPPAGTTVEVQVLAQMAGTNELVSALGTPLQFQGGVSSLEFLLNVPTTIPAFDLIATAIDLFEGATDPFPGHTLEVAGAVAGSGGGCVVPASPTVDLGPMECIGHGSITGTASNPDSGTTVRLAKDGVMLMESAVGPVPPASPAGNAFSFCAPPDTYTVQRFEEGVPVAAPVAVPLMAVPAAQASPCPSVCSFPDSTCPGICVNTALAGPL